MFQREYDYLSAKKIRRVFINNLVYDNISAKLLFTNSSLYLWCYPNQGAYIENILTVNKNIDR